MHLEIIPQTAQDDNLWSSSIASLDGSPDHSMHAVLASKHEGDTTKSTGYTAHIAYIPESSPQVDILDGNKCAAIPTSYSSRVSYDEVKESLG
ncbi:unnamed protein product, partial [Protopolystoma xenopodis]